MYGFKRHRQGEHQRSPSVERMPPIALGRETWGNQRPAIGGIMWETNGSPRSLCRWRLLCGKCGPCTGASRR